MSREPRIVVLCLGNDLRRDDGVGWKVAERLEAAPPPGAVVRRSALAGFYLIDDLLDFDAAVVVDAVRTGVHPPGDVFEMPLEAFAGPGGAAPHGVGLPTVVRVARAYGLAIPAWIRVVAIEVADMDTLAVGLTPAVEAAVPAAEALVRALVAAAATVGANG